MIKDRLSVLPARPVLFIVPLIVVLVLFFYYRDQYTKCTNIKQYRASLNALLRAEDLSGQFRLVDFTDFSWNKVRVVAKVGPDTISNPCLFDWNWENGERDSLLSAGLLTALVFGLDGKVVSYFELRGDEVEFLGGEGNLTPESAVFTIGRDFSKGSVTLTLDR